MTGDGWIALGGFALTLIVALTVASAWIAGRLAKVEGKLENGINESLRRLDRNVGRLFEKWDTLPCGEEAARISALERRIEAVEE